MKKKKACIPHINLLPLLLLHMLWMEASISMAAGGSGADSGLSTEGAALLELKAGLEDPFGHLSDWQAPSGNTSTSTSTTLFPCAWTGVTCNTSASVTGLDLSQRNLSGTLSDAAFRALPWLVSFNASCNALSGALPASLFSHVPGLVALDLSRNYFEAEFPPISPASLSSLSFFSAYSNNFTGAIPAAFSELPRLRHLDLGGSFFQGPIPPQLGALSSLTYLGLSGNLLVGPIPPELGALSQLQHMVIGYNKFSSHIPPEFGNLTNLLYMDLCCTNLSGPIPPELGRLGSLNTLFLYRNSLSGPIPPDLGQMSSLMSLDLSVNNLSGSVPPEFGGLRSLTLLSLMYNNLAGTLPQAIGELPNLLTLLIWNNSFSGPLPSTLGRASPLQWLDVSSNLFEGPVPPDLCRHSNLTKLIMFSNRLSGPIPESIARCPSLLRVRMQNNQLTGPIPPGFGSLPKLTRLEFQHNFLSGSIPPDLANSSVLNYLDVSFNALSGDLPVDIWNLANIQTFIASANNFTGPIPPEFESACATLTELALSHNYLSESIPPTIANCEKLIRVELQHNLLAGTIPKELASMQNLEVLDLSDNLLSGGIPYQFQNLTTLEAFNVSYNNLSGPVPFAGIFRTASSSSFVGNPYLCGGMLPHSCLDGSDQGTGSDGERRRRSSSLAMMWIVGCVFGVSLLVLMVGVRCVVKQYGARMKLFGCWYGSEDASEDVDEWPWRLTAFQRLAFTGNDIVGALKDENIVGRGATGTVYRAVMPSGEVVAVKKLWMSLKIKSSKGAKGSSKLVEPRGFEIEVDLLGSIRHRNIVRLLGYCSNNVNTLLIYEYMTNGSLHDALHGKDRGCILLADWVTRYNVAVGIAQGLCYLHHDCFPLVVHRDVKSNNILLDSNMEARVADFGVAKLVETANESMSMIAGSYGYIAPEYAYTLKVDEKTDIYSFGVVLLELLTGKRPIEPEFGDAVNIVEWVRGKVRCKAGIVDALDANVGASCTMVQEEMLLVLRIALLCTSRCPRDRPSMRDVVTMLAEAKPRRKSNNMGGSIMPMDVSDHNT